METVTDRPERTVLILADTPQLATTHSRYAAGEPGPGPHIHRQHADAFLVLEGELVFELGAEVERVMAGPDTFLLVPPEVVHTFRNEGRVDARFLNFHAPGMGFAEQLRNPDAPFDQFDAEPGTGRSASEAIVRTPGEGESLELGPARALFRVGGDDALGSLTVADQTLPPGFPGPVPHTHEGMVDSFYVLEGSLSVRAGEETHELGPGESLVAEPGTVHAFSNRTNTPVRALNVMAPGGFEAYLKEAAAVIVPGDPPDPAEMARIASKYDFHPA